MDPLDDTIERAQTMSRACSFGVKGHLAFKNYAHVSKGIWVCPNFFRGTLMPLDIFMGTMDLYPILPAIIHIYMFTLRCSTSVLYKTLRITQFKGKSSSF